MQTVRFQTVVDHAGKPEPHLLWTAPEKDKDLQKALKEHRVMTVHQNAVGTRADHGTVGFDQVRQGQVLIFPKSLAKFVDKKVVAIRYELYADEPVPATPAKLKSDRRKKKKTAAKRAQSAANIIEFRAPDSEPEAKGQRSVKSGRAKKAKSVPKSAPASKPKPNTEADLAAIQRKVRQAVKALEQGRQVKAHEILKTLLE